MRTWQRLCYDRRGGGDRRRVYSLDYFAGGGRERRGGRAQRRRKGGERRNNWVRVGLYTSAYCGWPQTTDDPACPEGEEPLIIVSGETE